MTPQLRFPDFTDGWQVKKLDDLLAMVVDNRGKTPPITTTGIPLIETNALGDKQVRYDVIKKFVTQNTFNSWFRKHLKDNDVLFSTVGQTGITALYDESIIAGIAQNIVGLRASEQTAGNFLYYLLTERRNNNKFKQIEMIAVQPSVKVSQMIHLSFKVPSKPEQEKIADFLTAADERIAVGEKKLELLETYKRGVIQKIFSQQIRFKDENGNTYPDWEEKKLGEIARIYQPLTISQSDLTKTGYPVYGANGIIGKYDRFNHENEQIAVTCRGNTCGVINYTQPKSWITGNAMVINMDDSSKADKKFMYYQLLSQNLNYLITGSGQPQITGDIKQHKVFVPFIKEQQKIADFLTTLDARITAEKSKLTAARQFKKALLQRMFV